MKLHLEGPCLGKLIDKVCPRTFDARNYRAWVLCTVKRNELSRWSMVMVPCGGAVKTAVPSDGANRHGEGVGCFVMVMSSSRGQDDETVDHGMGLK